ncbi:4272_t:CDS:2 [Diversispora eburnea]|uniref:4272_t:CDS:1 n=1 Tax=Diversispora eburnea TaxID=1213867 RepID=A0A9N8ZUA5_9GLOM|nr:4272_t:CDS:2 [Diversispora eburnea]
MGLASKVFQDMFDCATPSSQNDYNNNNGIYDKIPELTLEGESTALTFEDVLSFIYPNTFIPIGWNNVSEFLRIADKYMMDSVLSASKTFLEREFRKKPLYALYLADIYLFREIYKESTKLVFEKFPDYKRTNLFQELSIITRSKLINQYTKYTNALQKLSKIDFTSGYLHCTECSSSLNHNNEINKKFSERVRQSIYGSSTFEKI